MTSVPSGGPGSIVNLGGFLSASETSNYSLLEQRVTHFCGQILGNNTKNICKSRVVIQTSVWMVLVC